MGKKVNNLPIDMKIKSEPEGLPPSLFGAAPKGIHSDKVQAPKAKKCRFLQTFRP